MRNLLLITALTLILSQASAKACSSCDLKDTESEKIIAKMNIEVITEGEKEKGVIQKKIGNNLELCEEYNRSLKVLNKSEEIIHCNKRTNINTNNIDPEKELNNLNKTLNMFSEYERKIIFYNNFQ